MGVLLLKVWLKNKVTRKQIEEDFIPLLGKYFVDASIYIHTKDELKSELIKGYNLKQKWLEEQKTFELADNYEVPEKLNLKKMMVISFDCDNIRYEITDINQFNHIIYKFYNYFIENITKKFENIFYHIYLTTELLFTLKEKDRKITHNVRIELPKVSGINHKFKYNSKT